MVKFKRYRSYLVFALVFVGVLLASFSGSKSSQAAATTQQHRTRKTTVTCQALSTWISAPNPPQEIGNGVPIGDETNCQFYQFSWQWFLALTQPTASGSDERQFETFNIYQPNVQNQCASPKPAGKAAASKALFVRTLKARTGNFEPTLPEDMAQATGQALYDQAGNVVLYEVLYNSTECKATSEGFLPNTTEIKISWRILPGPNPNYYTMTANIPAISPNPITLGLVGFHLVINTADHPEFVWATFEHVANDPDCTNPQVTPTGGWSFLSNFCYVCLAKSQQCPGCNFNTGQPSHSLTGPPTQVCRVFNDGTDSGSMTGGNNNDVNRGNIDTLNAQITGPQGFLGQLPPSNPMSVWQNYKLVGGLWTNGGVGSGGTDVQRGSLENANTTMETFFQQQGQNCFTCHGYDPTAPLQVSHIISDLLPPSQGGSKMKRQKILN